MKIGFIGLGRMGLHMVERMLKNGQQVVVWNRSPGKMRIAENGGAQASASIGDMVSKLGKKRIVWLMLPSGDVTEQYFHQVLGFLEKGDIIIEGGNSNYKDSVRRHALCTEKGIDMIDAGVSGGLAGAEDGYAVMAGGKKEAVERCRPFFESIAVREGFAHVGGPGSGHYVKMVHNAIEYGMMQAIAEGFDLLENGSYKDMDLKKIAHLWNHGTIISSFLMQMAENALAKDERLGIAPFVNDSGEGRWAAIEAMEHSVPFVANTYALHARYTSRDENSMAFRLLAAIRNEFGGHEVKKKE